MASVGLWLLELEKRCRKLLDAGRQPATPAILDTGDGAIAVLSPYPRTIGSEEDWKEMLLYLHATEASGGQSPRKRLVLLGDAGAGKTTLKTMLRLESVEEDRLWMELRSLCDACQHCSERWGPAQLKEWLKDDLRLSLEECDKVLRECDSSFAQMLSWDSVAHLGSSRPLQRLQKCLALLRPAQATAAAPQEAFHEKFLTWVAQYVAPALPEPSHDRLDRHQARQIVLALPHVWTLGIDQEMLQLSPDCLIDVWDFAGQAEFLPVTKPFVGAQGSIFLLFVDARRQGADFLSSVTRWASVVLSSVPAHAATLPPFHVVVTHCDTVEQDAVDELERQLQHLHATQRSLSELLGDKWYTLLKYSDEACLGQLKERLLAACDVVDKNMDLHPGELMDTMERIAPLAKERSLFPVVPRSEFEEILTECAPEDKLHAPLIAALEAQGRLYAPPGDYIVLEPLQWLTKVACAALHPHHGLRAALPSKTAAGRSLDTYLLSTKAVRQCLERNVPKECRKPKRDEMRALMGLLVALGVCLDVDWLLAADSGAGLSRQPSQPSRANSIDGAGKAEDADVEAEETQPRYFFWSVATPADAAALEQERDTLHRAECRATELYFEQSSFAAGTVFAAACDLVLALARAWEANDIAFSSNLFAFRVGEARYALYVWHEQSTSSAVTLVTSAEPSKDVVDRTEALVLALGVAWQLTSSNGALPKPVRRTLQEKRDGHGVSAHPLLLGGVRAEPCLGAFKTPRTLHPCEFPEDGRTLRKLLAAGRAVQLPAAWERIHVIHEDALAFMDADAALALQIGDRLPRLQEEQLCDVELPRDTSCNASCRLNGGLVRASLYRVHYSTVAALPDSDLVLDDHMLKMHGWASRLPASDQAGGRDGTPEDMDESAVWVCVERAPLGTLQALMDGEVSLDAVQNLEIAISVDDALSALRRARPRFHSIMMRFSLIMPALSSMAFACSSRLAMRDLASLAMASARVCISWQIPTASPASSRIPGMKDGSKSVYLFTADAPC